MSKLRSALTGQPMKPAQAEFRAWNFRYAAGETYTLENGERYRVLATGTPRPEGNGATSVVVLVEAERLSAALKSDREEVK